MIDESTPLSEQTTQNDASLLPDEFIRALARYIEIRELEKKLSDEKDQLKQILNAHFESHGHKMTYAELEGQKWRVSRYERVDVTYDEGLLRQRLGSDYGNILSADPKKIKAQQQQLRTHLGENWPEYASPDRKKVQSLIEHGLLDAKQFEGAFVKKTKPIVVVASAKSQPEKEE